MFLASELTIQPIKQRGFTGKVVGKLCCNSIACKKLGHIMSILSIWDAADVRSNRLHRNLNFHVGISCRQGKRSEVLKIIFTFPLEL